MDPTFGCRRLRIDFVDAILSVEGRKESLFGAIVDSSLSPAIHELLHENRSYVPHIRVSHRSCKHRRF